MVGASYAMFNVVTDKQGRITRWMRYCMMPMSDVVPDDHECLMW